MIYLLGVQCRMTATTKGRPTDWRRATGYSPLTVVSEPNTLGNWCFRWWKEGVSRGLPVCKKTLSPSCHRFCQVAKLKGCGNASTPFKLPSACSYLRVISRQYTVQDKAYLLPSGHCLVLSSIDNANELLPNPNYDLRKRALPT